MGIRFSGESSGITMMNKVFHLFLVLVRIGLTAVCISLAFNEGWWVLENTVAKMFIKNQWTIDEKTDRIKFPFSAISFGSANPY